MLRAGSNKVYVGEVLISHQQGRRIESGSLCRGQVGWAALGGGNGTKRTKAGRVGVRFGNAGGPYVCGRGCAWNYKPSRLPLSSM